MKKLFFVMLIMVMALSAASLAAPAKTVAKEAPVVSAPAPAAGPIIGVEDGTPYMRFLMNRDQSMDVGLTYNNTNAANNNFFVWGRLNNKIGKVGSVATGWDAGVSLWSGKQAGADCTVIGLGGGVSAAYMILDNVEIYGNVVLLRIMSTNLAGASTTSYSLITGSGNCYSGIRVYL
jgi:hypothetical protein